MKYCLSDTSVSSVHLLISSFRGLQAFEDPLGTPDHSLPGSKIASVSPLDQRRLDVESGFGHGPSHFRLDTPIHSNTEP